MRATTLRLRLPILLLLPLLAATAGCKSGQREDPILRLSAEESLEMGKELLAAEKFFKARRHLEHAFEVEPNSRAGREALLLAADALFLQGGPDNYIKCEAKYRDFLNRFPTSERADYAQYQVGNCLASRVEKPDRDQRVTRQALTALDEMLRLYPTSEYVPLAEERILELRDRLAMHELVVARFYDRYRGGRSCNAKINRLETVEEEYPEFSAMDEVLFRLYVSYSECRRPEEATTARQRLVAEFPESELVSELPKAEERIAKELREQLELIEKLPARAESEAAEEAQDEISDGTIVEEEG